MTEKDIESWLNKGLLTDDEADRLRLKMIDKDREAEITEDQEFRWGEVRGDTDDDWYYAQQLKNNEW